MALTASMLLLLLLLAILLLSSLPVGRGGDAVSNSQNALRVARRQTERNSALHLADTGLRITMQWLSEQTVELPKTKAFAPSQVGTAFFGASLDSGYNVLTLGQTPGGSSFTSVNGTIRVRVFPAYDSVALRYLYMVESIGEYGSQRCVNHALIQPKSFGYYGIVWDEPLTSNFVAGLTKLSGPVHMNMRKSGTSSVDATARANFYWNKTNLIFTHDQSDYLTVSGNKDQVVWYIAGGGLQLPGLLDWPFITNAGVEPTYSVPMINFPTTAISTSEAALNGSAAPAAGAVAVPNDNTKVTGGIYVNGDVKTLALEASGTTQGITIVQAAGAGENKTVLTLDRAGGQTRVQRYSRATLAAAFVLSEDKTYVGATNGTLYVNGNIGDTTTKTGGLYGTVANSVMSGSSVLTRGALTIATPPDKTTQLCGGVAYKNLAGGDAANPTSAATATLSDSGTFGLVTGDLSIVTKDLLNRSLNEVALQGAILAMSQIGTVSYDSRPSGNFNFLGSYVTRRQGAMGTFNTATMTRISGFNTNRTYDPRLADNPPPTFPETNDFRVVSYQKDVAPLP
jgi:hypothetical protein